MLRPGVFGIAALVVLVEVAATVAGLPLVLSLLWLLLLLLPPEIVSRDLEMFSLLREGMGEQERVSSWAEISFRTFLRERSSWRILMATLLRWRRWRRTSRT